MMKKYEDSMNLIVFPFTHVRDFQRDALASCFGRLAMFSLDSSREHPGDSLETMTTLTLDEATVKAVNASLRAYREWAGITGGKRGELKAMLRDRPYFTSDSGVWNLKARISEGADSPPSGNGPDRDEQSFFESLLFLRLAQESDRENEAIDRQFRSLGKVEETLMSAIRGEIPAQPGSESVQEIPGVLEDPGSIQTEKRILSWSQLFRRENGRIESPGPLVLLTTSPAVIDYLAQRAEKSIKILDIINFKVHEGKSGQTGDWETTLHEAFLKAAAGEETEGIAAGRTMGGASTCIDISLHLFSGKDVIRIFCDEGKNHRSEGLFQWAGGRLPVCLAVIKNNNP